MMAGSSYSVQPSNETSVIHIDKILDLFFLGLDT
jgi:hypothetical protein